MIFINGKRLTYTRFPDKTSQVWHLPESMISGEIASVIWDYEDDHEIMLLAQISDLMRTKGIRILLCIQYLPYARQDKDISNDACFGLHSFARLLNTMDFHEISIIDPHSSRALDLINNSKAYYRVLPIKERDGIKYIANGYDLICYPDQGALKKYADLYDFPYVFAVKERDHASGAILDVALDDIHVGTVAGKKVLIIDDICDGGRTFIALADKLYRSFAKGVGLYVTHGLFTNGTEVLENAGIEIIKGE